jgi:phage-related tail protein
LQTTTAQWEIAKNRVTELSVNIGAVLLPAMNEVMGIFGGATSALADFSREHPTLVGNIATVVGTLGGLFAGVQTVTFAIGAATWAFNALKLAIATNPIGLALAVITTAAVLVYKNWEPIKAFFVGLWDSVVSGAKAAFQWVMDKLAVVGEYWGKFKAAFGFTSGASVEGSASAIASTPPPVPRMATTSYGAQVSAPQTNTFQITQQPGQDSKALADEIMRKMDERNAVQRRSIMFDRPMGY